MLVVEDDDAVAVLDQSELLKDNHRQLQRLTKQLAPGLQYVPGLGPVTAAIANAVYDVLEIRVRNLPITRDSLIAAMELS